jgi:hypothetical protein
MNYEEWQSAFCPVRTDTHTVHGSYIFQPYGDDLDFVRDLCDRQRVWTLLETDEGERIVEGMRFVNRIGYFVTVRPWSEPTEVTL